MVENPFVITEKIIPKYFCDRELESRQMVTLLANGNNVVLISPRRMGKTGLIQFCFQQPSISKDYITIYVDILSTTNLQEFTYLLGREVFDVIRHKGAGMWKTFLSIVKSVAGKIGFDPFTGLPSFNLQLGDVVQPSYTLKEIFQYLEKAGKPCILAIDEFQQIGKYPEKNVEALIRSHLLQINNCRMIFSGSQRHILSEMFTNSSRPFYQSASIMELPVIEEDVYTSWIVGMFEKGGKRISAEMAHNIYKAFDGVTFYVQRICNGIFANTENNHCATEKILELTLDGILSSYDAIYRQRLSQLTTRQKELLIAVAKEKKVEGISSMEFIKKYSLTSASAVQTALKSLLKSEIIVKSDNTYFIDDRFFTLWINRNF